MQYISRFVSYKLGELNKFFNFWGPPNSYLDQSEVVIIYAVSRGAGKNPGMMPGISPTNTAHHKQSYY